MFLENFIKRYLKLEAHPLFVVGETDEVMSFRICGHAMSVLADLTDLLNTLLGEEDGKFVVSLNLIDKQLDLKFVDAEC